jgi:hypothetical protein
MSAKLAFGKSMPFLGIEPTESIVNAEEFRGENGLELPACERSKKIHTEADCKLR